MFAARRCPRAQSAVVLPPAPRPWQQRRWRGVLLSQDMLQTATPLAEKLAGTGLWNYGRWAKKGGAEEEDGQEKSTKRAKGARAKGAKTKTPKPKGDRNRVNIVSEQLCDDILDYVRPSLARHRGCDLIDIYPGAGLWSRKLHDALQPRSHLLLEPDAALYRPFLADAGLLGRPGVSLIPKSGIVWRDLSSVLDAAHLPHQVEVTNTKEAPPPRNDTLLVTANLAFFPRRRFAVFESLTQLVLYQFVSSIRASALFHKYGLVRMLVWVEHHDRHALLARSAQRRRRLAIEGELATDWIAELAGPDDAAQQWFVRDQQLDRASVRRVLGRMAAAGVEMPAWRMTEGVREVLGAPKGEPTAPDAEPAAAPDAVPKRGRGRPKAVKDEPAAPAAEPKRGRGRPKTVKDEPAVPPRPRGRPKRVKDEPAAESTGPEGEPAPPDRPAVYVRPWRDELQQLEAAFAQGAFATGSADHRRLRSLRYRANREAKVADTLHALLQERDRLAAAAAETTMAGRPPTKAAVRAEAAWNAAVDALPANARNEFLLQRDNAHLLRQEPPVLAWDRRAQEPLAVRATEFFPNAPCALLDIQPKAMHPLLRAMGPGSGRAGDVFELVLRGMMAMGGEPVSKSIETVWPGAAAGVLPHCPSLRAEPGRGGAPVGGPYGELSARALNERQWVEILAAWMRWPFRPTLGQLVARIGDEGDGDPLDDELGDPMH